jgi:hypothetical protein
VKEDTYLEHTMSLNGRSGDIILTSITVNMDIIFYIAILF